MPNSLESMVVCDYSSHTVVYMCSYLVQAGYSKILEMECTVLQQFKLIGFSF